MDIRKKKNEIASLLVEWKNERPEYSESSKRFSEDGCSNLKKWFKSYPRIMFLLKEDRSEAGEYEPGWGITVDNKPFSKNIAKWRQIILELFMDLTNELSFDTIELPHIIDDIALVEVKKCNEGNGSSIMNNIISYAQMDRYFLAKQIDLLDPQVIICCFTGDIYGNIIYADDSWTMLCSENGCGLYKHGNRLVIDFYHPSTRSNIRAKELFDLLQRSIKKTSFNKFNWKVWEP